jgi:hypothetical protein
LPTLRRIDPDRERVAHAPVGAANPDPIADELVTPSLPRDMPRWAKDVIAVSARTRALLEKLKPIAIRIFSFWDHHVRSIIVGGHRLSVDPSGSYRMD